MTNELTNEQRRRVVATHLRTLGHEFMAHALTDAQLDEARDLVEQLTSLTKDGPARVRQRPHADLADFKLHVPSEGHANEHELFSDSVVSGSSNPLGLGATLHREGEVVVMSATLGKAFEGAPGRAHGGVVATLLDETMGMVPALHGLLAFTAQLDVTFVAPTPIGETLVARAWLVRRARRKLFLEASVHWGDVELVRAHAIFITVDPTTFLDQSTPAP